jgi:hypothetical protein
MLFGRQRLLLTLLDAVGEPVGHTDFQKLLFLYTRECEATPGYDFVPYKFGAFSFTSYADKQKLIEEGLLAEDDQNWKLTEVGRAALEQIAESTAAGKDFAFETTLSGRTNLPLLRGVKGMLCSTRSCGGNLNHEEINPIILDAAGHAGPDTCRGQGC